MVDKRTPAKFVHDWLTNLKVVITLITTIGLSSLYGNSETVKSLIHSKPGIVEIKPVPTIKPVEHKHDNHNARFSKIEKRVKKLETKVNANTINITTNSRWHE